MHDELRYATRKALMQDNTKETYTFRHTVKDTALPIRRWASFLPGTGLGGRSVHWNGQTFRFQDDDFQQRSRTVARYGKNFIPADVTIQDWGVTAAELERTSTASSTCLAPAAKPEILKARRFPAAIFSKIRARASIPRRRRRALRLCNLPQGGRRPRLPRLPAPVLQSEPALHQPRGAHAQYVHLLRILRALRVRALCQVLAPDDSAAGALEGSPTSSCAPGARCYASISTTPGKRPLVSPTSMRAARKSRLRASLIIVGAYATNNTRLLLLSKIGTPYDPASGKGVVGSNYAYQTMSYPQVFYDESININPFMRSGANGTMIADFAGDNFDHGPLGFIGGAYIGEIMTNGRPIGFHPTPPGTPPWGAKWKQAVVRHYNHTSTIQRSRQLGGNALELSRSRSHLQGCLGSAAAAHDLRFSGKRHQDVRLLYAEGDRSANRWAGNWSPDCRANALTISPNIRPRTIPAAPSWAPILPTSVVNLYLQSWDVPNVFVIGASNFPQNDVLDNPTDTLGALAYWAQTPS